MAFFSTLLTSCFGPARLMPVAAQVGRIGRNYDKVSSPSFDAVAAPRTDVALQGLKRLDGLHRDRHFEQRIKYRFLRAHTASMTG